MVARMRDEVMTVLGAAARKLLAVRAAESAAVGAVAGGLCAAAGEIGWSIARLSPVAGALVCVAPVLVGAWLGASGRLRRALHLSRRAGVLAAAVCVFAGLLGVACVLAGAHAVLPNYALPLILMPAAALAGALAEAARGVTPLEAGVFHDVRLHLAERLATAAELAGSRDADGPFAQCVYAQAMEAARRGRIDRQGVWRRTRATAGALALSVALCGALAFLPAPGAASVEARFERIGSDAADLSPQRRQAFVAELRRLAEQAKGNPKLLAALKAAAQAAQEQRPAELRAELDRARDALARESQAEALRVAQSLLKAMGLTDADGGGDANAPGRLAATDPNRPAVVDANAIIGDGGEKPLPARVFVYDPNYGAVADANTSPSGTGVFVPVADAWTAARDRAYAALATGRVPARYRRLVRRFFELE